MHALGPSGFGDGDVAVLRVPAEDDLRRGLAVSSGYLGDRFVGEGFAVVAERAVGFDGDPVPLGCFARFGVGEVGVQLELVDDGRDAGRGNNPVQVSGLEVGDAAALRRRPSATSSVNVFQVET